VGLTVGHAAEFRARNTQSAAISGSAVATCSAKTVSKTNFDLTWQCQEMEKGVSYPVQPPNCVWHPVPQWSVVVPHQLYCEQHSPDGHDPIPFPQVSRFSSLRSRGWFLGDMAGSELSLGPCPTTDPASDNMAAAKGKPNIECMVK